MVHTFDVSKTLHIGYMMPQHTAPYIRRRCRFPFSPHRGCHSDHVA